MFVLNVPGSTPKKKYTWHNKIYKYLALVTATFFILTLYCVALINTSTSAVQHDHLEDVVIVVDSLKDSSIKHKARKHGDEGEPAAALIKEEKEEAHIAEAHLAPPDKAYEPNIKPVEEAPIVATNIAPKAKAAEAPIIDNNIAHKAQAAAEVVENTSSEEDYYAYSFAVLSEPWGTPLKDLFVKEGFKYRLPGEDERTQPITQRMLTMRLNSIRESMRVCWKRYKECAWGMDQLYPDTCKGSRWFGLGTTIIDSLDTLFLMRLQEELAEAAQFIANIDYKHGANNVNIFEITIRVLGAFLTMFSLTKQQVYLNKAVELGDLMIDSGAFSTASGVPLSDIDLSTGKAHRPTCSGCSKHSSLSEVTTIQLEFNELTRLTKDPKYKAASDKAMDTILSNLPADKLPKIYVNVMTGKTEGVMTLGARGDSYYEYLLKQWIQTKNPRYEEAYLKAVSSIRDKLVFTSHRNLTYIAEITTGGKFSHKMDHLVCFLPGTLALGTLYGAPKWHLTLAESVIRTCVAMYHTTSQLAPEIIKFSPDTKMMLISRNDAFSLLRPETVESLFVLWRVTHNEKYRKWSWDIYSGLERSARAGNKGFSSMDKIDTSRPTRRNSMESFFLAETLKYLYLINMPEDVIPLTRYVFNTEAHPFPINPGDFAE